MVHPGQVPTLNLEHPIPMTLEQTADLTGGFTPEHCGAGYLGVIRMQDGQYRTVAGRVEERDSRPFEWRSFGLTITDNRDAQQVGVVQDRAEHCTRT
jgi:hypothetical protein